MGNLCIDFKKLTIKERIAYGEGMHAFMQEKLDRFTLSGYSSQIKLVQFGWCKVKFTKRFVH